MSLRNSEPYANSDTASFGSVPFWQYSWLVPRCAALNRFGQPCGNLARKDTGYCRYHSGDKRPRWMRKPHGPDNPQRAHRRAMEHLWRRDPWVPGFTCVLDDEAHQAFMRWLGGHGVRVDWLAPALANWLMWQFVGLARRHRLHDVEGDTVISTLRKHDAATPDPPPGHNPVDMTAASLACAWRPRLNLKGRWVQPSPLRGAHPHEPAAGLPIPRETGGGEALPWVPKVGPARLSTAERQALAGAAERDRLLGGGTREVRKAREAIVRERQARLGDAHCA